MLNLTYKTNFCSGNKHSNNSTQHPHLCMCELEINILKLREFTILLSDKVILCYYFTSSA